MDDRRDEFINKEWCPSGQCIFSAQSDFEPMQKIYICSNPQQAKTMSKAQQNKLKLRKLLMPKKDLIHFSKNGDDWADAVSYIQPNPRDGSKW
jgi:hypothetical protein